MSVSALASTAVDPPRERGSHSQLVTGRMGSPMLFLYSFPQTFLPPEAWKEFQGEPRDTGSPNSSLPVLGAPRSRPPSTAGVGSASSQVDTAPLSETGVGSPGREGADPREGRRSERGSGLPRLPEQGSWPRELGDTPHLCCPHSHLLLTPPQTPLSLHLAPQPIRSQGEHLSRHQRVLWTALRDKA